MANTLITPADLAPFATIDEAKAEAMIEDATAFALQVAPCLATTSEQSVLGIAKAILRTAILRWNEAGAGTTQQVTSGPFSTVYAQPARKTLLRPAEIQQLQNLCSDDTRGAAFDVDTMQTAPHRTARDLFVRDIEPDLA